MKEKREIIVVGGGLAGLASAMKAADLGCHVKLISLVPVKRSHSVCAQGGINSAINLMGERDSPDIHAYDTIKGADFLCDQPAVLEMCYNGPYIIRMMERLGVEFNRTPSGSLDFRRFGGTLYHRTAFAGASTGQQLLYALDEQVRRYEVKGLIEKFEHHEYMRSVLDNHGRVRGVVIMDHRNLNLISMKADAVVLATGGLGVIYQLSTNSTICTGAAAGRAYKQGVWFANGEFTQIHPTCIPGHDKLRLMSESARGEGGRVWVPGNPNVSIIFPDGTERPCGAKQGEPWYFLEEMYPAFGNLVPRDVASRAILRVCNAGMGINGKRQVYLDLTHLSPETLHKLESILDIYQKFTGEDPRSVPMRIYPGFHYEMGGLWCDWPDVLDPDRKERYRQMTNIPGLFAAGECEFTIHGANRLGANSLLSCIFGGMVAASEMDRFLENRDYSKEPIDETWFKKAEARELALKENLFARDGKENVFRLHQELAEIMVSSVSVERHNHDLREALRKIKDIRDRYQNISLDDKGNQLNQSYIFANQFDSMLELALVITKGALERDEFRGSHYKPEFPKRDDENWLKTTIAVYVDGEDEPQISYRAVDIRYFDPIERDYTNAKRVSAKPKNLPPIEKIAIVTEADYGRR